MAASRAVIVMCDSAEISGHTLHQGLQGFPMPLHHVLDRDTQSRVDTIVSLMQQAELLALPKNTNPPSSRFSIELASFNTLLNSIHIDQQATDPRDKIYALLGMSTDFPHDLYPPDYTLPWSLLFRRTLASIPSIGTPFSISTWNDKLLASIKTKILVLGVFVRPWNWTANVVTTTEWKPVGNWTLTNDFHSSMFYASWNSRSGEGRHNQIAVLMDYHVVSLREVIQPGDLLCFLHGASRAIVLRVRNYRCEIVSTAFRLGATTKGGILGGPLRELMPQDVEGAEYREGSVVWDWGPSSSSSGTETETGSEKQDMDVTHIQTAALLLRDGRIFKPALDHFQKVAGRYETEYGLHDSRTAAVIGQLLPTYEQWMACELEEWETDVAKTSRTGKNILQTPAHSVDDLLTRPGMERYVSEIPEGLVTRLVRALDFRRLKQLLGRYSLTECSVRKIAEMLEGRVATGVAADEVVEMSALFLDRRGEQVVSVGLLAGVERAAEAVRLGEGGSSEVAVFLEAWKTDGETAVRRVLETREIRTKESPEERCGELCGTDDEVPWYEKVEKIVLPSAFPDEE